MMKNKAIFLDRDGVINKEKEFVYKKKDVFILPGVIDALRILKEKGYFLICITNQPLIARGLATEEEMVEIHNFINYKVENLIDKFYFCPHHPEQRDDIPNFAKKYRIKCKCRKPSPGMILLAAKEFNIDLKESWMIGDMITDIIAGKSAGCKTIMIKSQKNDTIILSSSLFNIHVKPDKYFKTLLESAKFIVNQKIN
jgi:D,D-heptose 1,7-bisphosphate phosphatase